MAADLYDRLREHPAKRFADPVRIVDLRESLKDLASEAHEGTDGHRQITIFHEAHLAMVLFHFEPGGRLPQHEIDGQLSLQVVEGELEIETDDETHTLLAGQLIVIGRDISFSLRATKKAQMLMTVHLLREEEREAL